MPVHGVGMKPESYPFFKLSKEWNLPYEAVLIVADGFMRERKTAAFWHWRDRMSVAARMSIQNAVADQIDIRVDLVDWETGEPRQPVVADKPRDRPTPDQLYRCPRCLYICTEGDMEADAARAGDGDEVWSNSICPACKAWHRLEDWETGEPQEDRALPHYRIEAAMHQLERYGGSPDSRVLALLEMLTDINDDICHMRNPAPAISKARELLDQIEKTPTLTLEEDE